MLAISAWRWLILIFVHLILLCMSECSAFFIMACSNLLPFHLICKVFGVTLFDVTLFPFSLGLLTQKTINTSHLLDLHLQ